MSDETEVIESTHTCDENGIKNTGRKSPNYIDTKVSENDRTVKFWNRLEFSDITQGRNRKARFGIGIDGEVTWLDWESYVSPKPPSSYEPEKEITVPDNGEPEHEFSITTEYEVKEIDDMTEKTIARDSKGPYAATVKES